MTTMATQNTPLHAASYKPIDMVPRRSKMKRVCEGPNEANQSRKLIRQRVANRPKIFIQALSRIRHGPTPPKYSMTGNMIQKQPFGSRNKLNRVDFGWGGSCLLFEYFESRQFAAVCCHWTFGSDQRADTIRCNHFILTERTRVGSPAMLLTASQKAGVTFSFELLDSFQSWPDAVLHNAQ